MADQKISDEKAEELALAAGWTRHENGVDWLSPKGGEFIEGSAYAACLIDGLIEDESPQSAVSYSI